MIRLIVSDLDGTLLSGENSIHPENLAALREAMARGVHFAAASGRSAPSCSVLMEAHGLMDASILGTNGAHILEKPHGRLLGLYPLPEGAARATLDSYAAHGLEGCLFTRDAVIYTSREKFRYESQDSMDALAQAGLRIGGGPEAIDEALAASPALKTFCFLNDDTAAFEAARAECARIPGVELTSSWINNFEVMPAGVDKGTAVRDLAERLGIAREEVLAFGDNDNDLSMLRWAGVGVAMGNAVPTVLAEIEHVTGLCGEGGVAQGIRRWVLDAR